MQHSAATEERQMREIKSTKRFNATQRSSARKRNDRNKVDEKVQRNAAPQCKREKSEK